LLTHSTNSAWRGLKERSVQLNSRQSYTRDSMRYQTSLALIKNLESTTLGLMSNTAARVSTSKAAVFRTRVFKKLIINSRMKSCSEQEKQWY
jgi:hypothetical protein